LRDRELLERLASIQKAFFTLSDLEKITGLKKSSLHVAVNRWVDRGVLERAARNAYVIPGARVSIEMIAENLYFPCYLSFESALSRYGVLNLVPYTLSFATTRKTRSMTVLERRVEFRHLKEDLFFGFTMVEGLYVAEAEKALLDLTYFASFGRTTIPVGELDLSSLSRKRLKEYGRRFPPRVYAALAKLQ
jgi:predicted transcriptional regulator of viral defense system